MTDRISVDERDALLLHTQDLDGARGLEVPKERGERVAELIVVFIAAFALWGVLIFLWIASAT